MRNRDRSCVDLILSDVSRFAMCATRTISHSCCILTLTCTAYVPQIVPAVGTSPPSLRFQIALRSSRLWHSHNSMATTLAPVAAREVVRCDHCLMVQFSTHENCC